MRAVVINKVVWRRRGRERERRGTTLFRCPTPGTLLLQWLNLLLANVVPYGPRTQRRCYGIAKPLKKVRGGALL